jgi:hypothetical protein
MPNHLQSQVPGLFRLTFNSIHLGSSLRAGASRPKVHDCVSRFRRRYLTVLMEPCDSSGSPLLVGPAIQSCIES